MIALALVCIGLVASGAAGRLAADSLLPAVLLASLAPLSTPSGAADPSPLERDLVVSVEGGEKRVSIDEALSLLAIPSASVALIDEGRIAFARAYGRDATPSTLYQAASLSKFVTAIGAMRLAENGTLKLDEDVNDRLTSWKVPNNSFDSTHKVTLRGLLSMTGGTGVPGYVGYDAGAPLPTLTQILDGTPPANSPPVTVIAVPGSAYHYSGGGYEEVAGVEDVLAAWWPQDAFVVNFPFWPIAAGLAFAALGAVLRHGAHLQRETEGLV